MSAKLNAVFNEAVAPASVLWQVLDALPFLVWMLDPDARLLHADPAGMAVWGASTQDNVAVSY